ncbi:MAG: CBS domain-containing protein [Bacteroidota bacterium]|nr:CBS domain-containing protein [Bacteroidota bacterium]
MIAKNIISDSFITLKTSDTGQMALLLMDDYKVNHLPIVNNKEFLGLVSENDILSYNLPKEPLGNHPLSLSNPYVTENQHIYEVIKLISELKLTLIPVLDNNNNYLGVITLSKLLQQIAKIGAINNPGAIIILEINVRDYLLTEIAQIIESNDGKVLSLYVTSHPDSTKMEVTIKLNKTEISGILQTFNRYNYNIKASYKENDMLDDLKERYESFLTYINM